jgi:WD40 repeat protein/O-acetyl-ADP-ribose deacetylase (regulator of RNase III)
VLKEDLSSLGYSGSWVYRVHLLRGDESPELPLVVKLAPASLIAKEVRAYQDCVRNQWPGIAELRGAPVYLEGSDLGGLCYPLMGGGVFRMQSLREYCLEARTEDVCFVLQERLFWLMQERMLRPARNVFEHPLRASYDRVLPVNLVVEPGAVGQTQGIEPTLVAPDALPHSPLQPGDVVRLEGFVVSEVNPRQRSVTLNVPADRMRNAYRLRLCPVKDLSIYAVGEVMPPTDGVVRETRQSLLHKELAKTFGLGSDPLSETVTLPGDDDSRVILPNPLLSIPKILGGTRHVKVNAIHGDLNLENVLVDPQVRDVRLIDFAEARQDHVLHDFLRLETEVATKVLPLALSAAGLPPQAAHAFYEQLHCATFQFDQGGAYRLFHAALEKPFAILSAIREAAREGFYDRNDVCEYYRGLVVYLLGALKYGNLDTVPSAKRIAFWCAASIRSLIEGDSPCDKYLPVYRADSPCPYRGLFAFQEEHAPMFFGREELTRQLLDRLRDTLWTGQGYRLLAIIGPSGSGKSSLARAGLVAALRNGALPGSENWRLADCRPGDDPLDSLSAALYRAGVIGLREADDLRRGMLDSERALHYVTYETSPEAQLVLLVDQFEEIFALCRDVAVRQAFIDNLLYATGVGSGRVAVLMTLRADFYGHCADTRLAELLPTYQALIRPMTEAELRKAIEQPAYLSGRTFEAGLVERLLADVRHRVGGLPLLQHALLSLWMSCSGRQLTHAAYEEIGRVAGVLEKQAESVYGRLPRSAQVTCQRIFLRLIQPGEGAADTSRRASFAELLPSTGDVDMLFEVVGRLVDARLLTTGGDQKDGSVELAHEALIQGWHRLQTWIDENRESLRVHRRLTESAYEWAESGRDSSYLYWGTRLVRVETWAENHQDGLSELEEAFLTASRAEQDKIAGQAKRGLSQSLATSSSGILWRDGNLALLLAIEAGRAARTPEADQALRKALLRLQTVAQLAGHTGAVRCAAWCGDGSRLATGGADGTVRVWDAETGRQLLVMSEHTDEVWRVKWNRAGTYLASASHDGTASVWHGERGVQVAVLAGHVGWVNDVAWSPDGTRIVTAGGDGTARVWDAKTGVPMLVFEGHRDVSAPWMLVNDRLCRDDEVRCVSWNSDGTRIVSASADGTARVWGADLGRQLLVLRHGEPVWSQLYHTAWSPDGTRIVTAGYDTAVKVWNAENGEELLVLTGHTGWVYCAVWSPDGMRIITASKDCTACVWDGQTGVLLNVLAGHMGSVRHVAWNSSGSLVTTASSDSMARVWNAEQGAELAVLSGHSERVRCAIWNPEGARIATVSDDGTVLIWNVSGVTEQAVHLDKLDHEGLLEAACQRIVRNMSQEEWRVYMGDEPYRETCPDRPVPGVTEFRVRDTTIRLVFGDILEVDADVIVSSGLTMEHGVARAIREAAGESVLQDAAKHAPLRVGDVVVTSGGRLSASHIFHVAVADREGGIAPSKESIRCVVLKSLELVDALDLRRIAFPMLGIGGAERFPFMSAVEVMTRAIVEYLNKETRIGLITIVLHAPGHIGRKMLDMFCRELEGLA